MKWWKVSGAKVEMNLTQSKLQIANCKCNIVKRYKTHNLHIYTNVMVFSVVFGCALVRVGVNE